MVTMVTKAAATAKGSLGHPSPSRAVALLLSLLVSPRVSSFAPHTSRPCLSNANKVGARRLLKSSSSSSTSTSPSSPSSPSSPPTAVCNHNFIGGLPPYSIASVDLAQTWYELVRAGDVVATTTIPADDGAADGKVHTLRYGIRTVDTGADGEELSTACMEFVEEVPSDDDASRSTHPLVEQINATLSRMQSIISSGDGPTRQQSPSQYAVQYERRGNFAAQLQLVRTLRPPPSAGFAASGGDVVTCHPLPYNAEKDSFVVGPLRLQLRPLVATISAATDFSKDLSTSWEIYHNVSPADCRGHYLLIPALTDEESNWREQVLIESDCKDLVVLASTIEPAGSVLVCYNSVGAGASQNHIHAHMWPSPPIPLLPVEGSDEVHGWDCYAASRAAAASSFEVERCVEVAMLEYPCCCIKLSSLKTDQLGLVLAKVVDVVQSHFDAPHNVGLLNRPDGVVDVYVFVRSRERSPRIVPGSRAGASEAMGLFHTSKEHDIKELSSDQTYGESNEGSMETVLRDISIVNRSAVWESVRAALRE